MKDNKTDFDKKWKSAFGNSFGIPGAAAGNAKAIEVDGVKYDSITAASNSLGKTPAWVKKHGKILK